MAVAGDLITYKDPKWQYQHDYYLVMYGWKDQNGIVYKVVSLGYAKGQAKRAGRLSMSILDRESKVVGKLSGDEFYDIKDTYYKTWGPTDWDKPEKAVYGAEPQ